MRQNDRKKIHKRNNRNVEWVTLTVTARVYVTQLLKVELSKDGGQSAEPHRVALAQSATGSGRRVSRPPTLESAAAVTSIAAVLSTRGHHLAVFISRTNLYI